MSQSRIEHGSSDSARELGDETFMSAAELRNYVKQTEMARALKDVDSSGGTNKAREELIRSLLQPVAVTPEKIAEVKRRVFGQLRTAAGKGDKEVLVMRFPNALCTDKGRALNNSEKEWPSTLIGRPLQAFEFWRDHLKPQGYGLKAMIVDWPQGLPGDIGFFLTWDEAKR
ncbi:hypothetical protein [Bradyrhizobium canariense]|uniref:Uncharacterized protein n=1 Tax=Bradyrhizobium canariense TaxID=255045 RepID=A0A1H1Y050_9BRAD|nr:hypothetical protein [Bradyrhizobium canariense]SDT14810.1 hypothetical protein SAMN05444158_4570 [Bradyrhizobium canariense]